MEKQNQGLRVKKVELTVTHNGKDLIFLHPAYGPGTYTAVGEQIEKDGFKRPTMAETVSLVHAAFNSNDKYSNEIKKITEEDWLWTFIGILYVPKKGVYIQDDPKISLGIPCMNESDLVKKLEASDPSVRFVPFGYKIGTMSALELAKNDYLKALAGEEGAQKLAEVAGKYGKNPYLLSFESVDEPLTRVSSMGSGRSLGTHKLFVNGYYDGHYWNSCALGTQKNTKEEK